MDRAVVHGSTFAKNDMAMVAGLATLDVLGQERLIENAAHQGERLLNSFQAMAARHELMKNVRGKGLMIGVEFGAPKSFALKMSWNALETVSSGLFCQMITIPLFKEHKILVQVAGHASHTVKLLPPLIITEEDCKWIEEAFEATIAAAHKVPGAVWSLGKTLADHALRARASA
jgi:ornithine--oxo-acid transaminase